MKVSADEIVAGNADMDWMLPRRVVLGGNNVHEFQNYAAGLGANGFERVNYFALLTGVRVRNNVQAGVSASPVDFVAAALPKQAVRDALPEADRPTRDAIFLYSGEERQVLLLVKDGAAGEPLIRYLPVRNLKQDAAGQVTFERQDCVPGLPLRYFEDNDFVTGAAAFLGGWHSADEWFQATHRTRYSNGIIGLMEHFGPMKSGSPWEDAGPDAPVLRRFAQRLREATPADLLVLANDHWNFNARGFNPGGNHGSFLRASTHSVLMMTGGDVPQGLVVDRPYDSLSFVPTILALTRRGDPKKFAGPVIQELLGSPEGTRTE